MTKNLYLVLGDVFSSRKISDNKKFLIKLEEACETINKNYSQDIYAKFKILKGIDEIGGVLSSIKYIYEIISIFFDNLYPNSMRFVVVLDEIRDPLGTKEVEKMSGSAFVKASEHMAVLKKSDLTVDIAIENDPYGRLMADIINLITRLKKDLSPTKYQILKEYLENRSQTRVAEKLGISQQAVSKSLDSIPWEEIKEIEERLNYMLRHQYSGRSKGG